eukprot:29188-Pelagococcus_subviridis.AAC.1
MIPSNVIIAPPSSPCLLCAPAWRRSRRVRAATPAATVLPAFPGGTPTSSAMPARNCAGTPTTPVVLRCDAASSANSTAALKIPDRALSGRTRSLTDALAAWHASLNATRSAGSYSTPLTRLALSAARTDRATRPPARFRRVRGRRALRGFLRLSSPAFLRGGFAEPGARAETLQRPAERVPAGPARERVLDPDFSPAQRPVLHPSPRSAPARRFPSRAAAAERRQRQPAAAARGEAEDSEGRSIQANVGVELKGVRWRSKASRAGIESEGWAERCAGQSP